MCGRHAERAYFGEFVLSFHHEGSGDPTTVIELGNTIALAS